jgi:dipeptidyl aminopeptidase/acylaminoacyl peptidase
MILKDAHFKVDGLDIYGQYYLPGNDTKYPAVCICHGIPARRPDSGERGYSELAERVCREGFATLIFNFRGTGTSSGDIDLPGWMHDLKAAIDFLVIAPEVDSKKITLLGFSAGAAVSVCSAATDKRIAAVVGCACPAIFNMFSRSQEVESLISHFRDIGIIRNAAYPSSAREWLEGFRSVSAIDCVAGISPRPLLLVHGALDEVVRLGDARRLYERAGEPKRLAVIDGAGHRLRQDPQAMKTVINWLRAVNKLTRR